MYIGILCTMIDGFGRRGYDNSQEVGLGRALARKGHTVIIYKGVYPEDRADEIGIEERLDIRYIPMEHVGAHGKMNTDLLDIKLDGLFCFSDQQIFLPHVYKWCRHNEVCFIPYVGTAHSLGHNLKSLVMNTIFAMGTLKIYKHVTVVAKTVAAEDELLSLGVSDTKVAPAGLDEAVLKRDFRKYDRDAIRREYGFAPDDVILCNVSGFSPEKRPLELIDIFLKVRGKKKFKLIIVGKGPLEAELHAKISENDLWGEVNVYPEIPYDRMWEIYVMSDYYLNLNKGEIFGMSVMEAVYYCISVAAVKAIGPSTTLKDLRGHKLCDNDDDIARWVLAPYPDRTDLEVSAYKLQKNFSWNKCADTIVDIIKDKQ